MKKNKKLVGLLCQSNRLRTLDLSKNAKLKQLDCSGNKKLKKLDIKKNKYLLGYVKKIEKYKSTDNVEWVMDAEMRITIPVTCKLYNGKKVLYKGK